MQADQKYKLGIQYGIITGVLYIILLFIRYRFTYLNSNYIGILAVISYVVILVMFLVTGIMRRKQLGGTAEMKNIFQTIFITILITELCYVIFNWIYLKYIDPGFWEKLKSVSLEILKKAKIPQDQIDEQMKGFKDADQLTKPMGLIKGYGSSVVIDSIFGLLFASLLRKKTPVIASDAPKS
jgi:heme/copper-type cytochrome/quinol oxidase subunit 4